MNIMKSCLLELFIVIAILVAGYAINAEEVVFLLKYDDIGTVIAAVGLLWFIGSIFRINNAWAAKLTSWACAIGIFLFGHVLTEYGIFYACCVCGCYMIFLSYILTSVVGKNRILIPLVAIGILLSMGGYHFRKYSVPLAKDEALKERPVDLSAEWRLTIAFDNGSGTERTYWDIYGTQQEATQEAKEIHRNFMFQNPHQTIYETELICLKVPKWYARKYGWPTNPVHSF